jgi:hypothetical protein
MKKRFKKKYILIVFCVSIVFILFFIYYQIVWKVEKAPDWKTVGRYENKLIGFSVEYDAAKLTKDLPLSGSFVFRKAAMQDFPQLGITANPYSSRRTLKGTASLIAGVMKRSIQGSRIHKIYNQELIELWDGIEANYFKMKWYDGSSELISAFVVAKAREQMIVVSASDRVKGSMGNLTAMVKSLEFDVEVDEAALRARGFAKDGKFVRTDLPAFSIDYPKNFIMRPLQPGQIFRAGIPDGTPVIDITIYPLKSDDDINEQLKAIARIYAKVLESMGTHVKIISNKPTDYYKEFPAYQFEIKWKFQAQYPLITVVQVIAKESNAIQLGGHTAYDTGELLDIFKTINLNP